MPTTARTSKLVDLQTAIQTIRPGCALATGGLGLQNKPCTFVRALVRAGVGDLELYSSPLASYDADLLVGAGLVATSYVPAVSLDHVGLAPNYTRALLAGTLNVVTTSESLLLGGYLATAEGTPYHLVASLAGTHFEHNPLVIELVAPDGERLHAVKALAPDVAVIHVQEADCYGNGRHHGAMTADRFIFDAARRVILTADRIISNDEVRANPRLTTIPAYKVDMVVHLPYGAHPCPSPGLYSHDQEHLAAYFRESRTVAGFQAYLDRYVREPASHNEYLQLCGLTSP